MIVDLARTSSVALSIGLWLALSLSSSAQEVAAAPEGGGERVTATCRLVEFDLEDGTVKLIGNVVVTWQGVRVRCDNAVIWPSRSLLGETNGERDETTGDADVAIRANEIYAEGMVVFSQLEEGRSFRCHRLFYDLVRQRALATESTLRQDLPGRDKPVPLIFRAAELRQLDRRRFELLDVEAAASADLEPGYRIRTEAMRFQVDPAVPARDGLPARERNIRYEIDSSVLYVGDLPILPTPPFSGDTASRRAFSWFRGAGADISGKFGPSVRLTVGQEIEIGGERWGDVEVPVQYLGDRGPGIGLDLKYAREDHRGVFEGFYQRDRGQDELFGVPPDRDRGRATWRHRHDLPEHIQLDLEFSKLSDRGFLPEYYEREFKSEKEQETLIYAKRAVDNRAATLLLKGRINDFQTQTEFLPQFGYNLISEPVVDLGFSTLYFDADYEAARARRKFDDALGLGDYDATRVDLDNRVALPFFLGPFKLEPFVGLRYTYYSDGALKDRNFHRLGSLYGARLTTQFWKSFDVSGGLFDLDGLRHIVTPTLEYRAIGHVSNDTVDYFQFDRVDAFSEREEIRVGVRNRLQTLWYFDDRPEVVDFVDRDVLWSYFPQAGRDNFGDHAGNLDVDFLFRPTRDLTLTLDFEYSFVLDTMEIFNTTVGYQFSRELLVALGYRRYVGVNDTVLGLVNWRVDPKLAIEVQSGYDFVEDRSQDQRLVFRRIGEDWVFEVELEYDNSGNYGFSIGFSPSALFDPRVRVSAIRDEPRFSGFGDELLRR